LFTFALHTKGRLKALPMVPPEDRTAQERKRCHNRKGNNLFAIHFPK